MFRIKTILITLFLISSGSAYATNAEAVGASPYATSAKFSIDSDQKPMASVVPTIEDRPMYGPKYKWLILNFYSFPLTPENMASAQAGDLKPIEKRTYEGDANAHNNSNAKIILSIDSTNNQITQVDMSVPGYSCTIAEKPEDLKKFSQNFSLENNHIKLKNNGSYECDMDAKKVSFSWDFNIDSPVYQKPANK